MARFVAAALAALGFAGTAAAHAPSAIVVDTDGTIYFSDGSRGIWRLAEGKASLIDPHPVHWMALDVEGRFPAAGRKIAKHFERVALLGSNSVLITCGGSPVALGRGGTIYYAPDMNVARVSPGSEEKILVPRKALGAGDHPWGITGMSSGPERAVYVFATDSFNVNEATGAHAIFKVTEDGKMTAHARDFVKSQIPESDRPPQVKSTYCRGLAVDDDGGVYVAATGSRSVIHVPREGRPRIVLEAAKPWSPTGVAVRKGEVFVLEHDEETPVPHGEWPPRVRKVDHDGKVSTLYPLERGEAKVPDAAKKAPESSGRSPR